MGVLLLSAVLLMCGLSGYTEGARDRLPRVAGQSGATHLGLLSAGDLASDVGEVVQLGERLTRRVGREGGVTVHVCQLRLTDIAASMVVDVALVIHRFQGLRMCQACDQWAMSRMLQVRNLPDDVHARLKERAAAERMSLSDYVARELERLVRYRSNAEIIAAARDRARAGEYALTREQILDGLHEVRTERDAELDRR